MPAPTMLCVCVCACMHAQLWLTLCDPMDCSLQAPLSMGFSRQEYWSGLPFPTSGNFPKPGIWFSPKLHLLCFLPWAGGFFTTSTTWETHSVAQGLFTYRKQAHHRILWNLTYLREFDLSLIKKEEQQRLDDGEKFSYKQVVYSHNIPHPPCYHRRTICLLQINVSNGSGCCDLAELLTSGLNASK